MNILKIDTSSNQEVTVSLTINGEEIISKEVLGKKKAQVVLPLVEQMLKENNLSLLDLSEIVVNTGPGSFTGLRVGVTIANTLADFLRIPVNQQKVGEFVVPHYSPSKFDI